MDVIRFTVTLPADVYQALLARKIDAKENVPMTRVIVDLLRAQLAYQGHLAVDHPLVVREPRDDGEWTRLPGGAGQLPHRTSSSWTAEHFEEVHAVDDTPYQFKEDE